MATALKDTPVVMVNGPRQCGKTTLVREFTGRNRTYITLDDDTVLGAVRDDPSGFVRGLDMVIVDEVQRAPELLRTIKKSVDADRRPGRFLLTGSANVLALPQVSESLAGRMEIITLLPLGRSEILGKPPTFLENALAGKIAKPFEIIIGDDLVGAVLAGGYPEMLRRKDQKRRRAWARDYIKAIVERDIRDIADLNKLAQMPRLLQVLDHQKVCCHHRAIVPRASGRTLVSESAQAIGENAQASLHRLRLARGHRRGDRGARRQGPFNPWPTA